MERNPENVETRMRFELKPASYRTATVRALGMIAIEGVQEEELVSRQILQNIGF